MEAIRLRRRAQTLVAGGGSLPGVGPLAGAEIDKVGGALQDEILGTTSPIDSKDPISNMSPQLASRHILSAMAAVGNDVALPQAHYDAGRNLVYPPGAQAVLVDGEIVCPPGVSQPNTKPRSCRPSLTHWGRQPGGYSAFEGMEDAYNGVTENPNPHK